jgi:hypothetical protein
VKSLTSLWSSAADEMAAWCCTSATRDKTTVASRVEHEGLSFLAITLADLGKATQKWLDQGLVVPSDCPAFKPQGGQSRLPAFLSGFYGRVFDPCSGVLLDTPCIDSIRALRQLTLMFSKIALPPEPHKGYGTRKTTTVVSPRRTRQAMRGYVEIEQDVRAADARLDPSYREDFKRMSAMLFGDLFSKVDRDIYWDRIQPKHGPGTVADRLSSNAKWDSHTWTARLQRVFSAGTHLIPNRRYIGWLESDLNVLEPGAEVPVRVITVPKTLKTPRIIAIEPTPMQYMQQGLLRSFLNAFLEDGFLSRVVGFNDQEPNRELAHQGSHSGDLATLDLSEASDRVSNQHVLAMFEDWPLLSEAIQATRSRKADVPGHGVIRLAKYASMGSALCFPVEAMVFLTIIFLGIERELNTPLCRETVSKRFSDKVRVFGDDLIVPRDYVLSVVHELDAFGHKVNMGKSFWTGRFRESCGREYYDGHDVSIVKVRRVLPTRRQDASEVISAVALRNALYWAGLWKTTAFMDEYIRKIITFFPNVTSRSSLLGRESVLGFEFRTLDPYHQSPITKGYRKVTKTPSDVLEGPGALLKCLNQVPQRAVLDRFCYLPEPYRQDPLSALPSVDSEHLERFGRPEHVNIKLGWGSPC